MILFSINSVGSELEATMSPEGENSNFQEILSIQFITLFLFALISDIGEGVDVQRISCRLYSQCLEVIPVLVRQWWKDQDRKTAAYVEK